MNSDSFFTIGYDHKICEDFSISKDIVFEDGKKVSIAITSDGCSGSGKFVNVDFGARILSYAFLQEFSKPTFHQCLNKVKPEDLDYEACIMAFAKSAYISSRNTLLNLGLSDSRFLDVTLVFAFADERSGKVTSGIFGDGTIVAKYKHGGYKIYNVKFSNNTPYYLNYRENRSRGEEYESFIGENISQFIYNEHMINGDEIASRLELYPFNWLFFRQDLISDLQSISVISDGMESFLNSENEKIELLDIYKEFVDYKTFGGKFVTRRLANGLPDFMKKNNYHHYDDISCSAIHF